MADKKICIKKGCGGEIVLDQPVLLRVGCSSFNSAFPCKICGKLHWGDGLEVRNRPGDEAYLKEGKIVNVKSNGEEYTL